MELLTVLHTSKEYESLNIEEKEIMSRLARAFQQDDTALYLSPQELATHLTLGNKRQWAKFLTMTSVKNYIDHHISLQTQAAYRKALLSLKVEAEKGNVAAAREINALADARKTDTANLQIIMIRVDRPSVGESEAIPEERQSQPSAQGTGHSQT